MKHNLSDLNGYLFEQLERLNDLDLTGTELEEEILRTKAVTSIADNVIKTGQLALEGQKLVENRMNANTTLHKMLE